MVVFTCNNCGESLRKPSIEKHFNFVCRKVKSLTCVDCLKDFRDEEYVAHTKCLSEEERYAAKGSMPLGVAKKGELKQESWVDMIKSILGEPNLKPSHRNLLTTISTYDNIPRKKPKFLNFIKSSSGGRINMKDVEDVWNIIQSYTVKKAPQQNIKVQDDLSNESKKSENVSNKRKNNEDISNGVTESPEQKKKKKKGSKTSEEEKEISQEITPVEDLGQNEKFDFQSKIISVLEDKRTISLKKLQKKVVNAYLEHSGKTEITPKILKKFSKKLEKIPNVEITDAYVFLRK